MLRKSLNILSRSTLTCGRLLALLATIGIILLLTAFTRPDNAAASLPPRPTGIPPVVTAVPFPNSPTANGSQIQLQITNPVEEIPLHLWTAIEWQDHDTGDWHIVEGWRGTLDAPTSQTWWVGSELFGAGPFRWQLYAGENGDLLTTSDLFYLPTQTWESILVQVTLASN